MAIPLRKPGIQEPASVPPEVQILVAPARQAFNVLRVTFILLPLVAGIDKFFNVLVGWSVYLSPSVNSSLGLTAPAFMRIVGVIEIVAGLGVAVSPRIFGGIVCLWLLAICANLIILGGGGDIVIRDLALAAAALAMSRLGSQFEAVPRRRLQALQ